jgi:hypothetical protein
MLHLMPFMLNNTKWSNYIQLLYREISIDEILAKEMTGRKIFISNGLSMVYLLLNSINSSFLDHPIPFNSQVIYNQLQNSDAWKALIERDYFFKIHQGLLNGFPGVLLVSHELRELIRNNTK